MDLITQHQYQTKMAASPMRNVPTSNGKPPQKTKGCYGNKGWTKYILLGWVYIEILDKLLIFDSVYRNLHNSTGLTYVTQCHATIML